VKAVFLGLSVTSSWGNGHATNYRALLPALAARGHDVLFLERDVPWYAAHRDFDAPFVRLYGSVEELRGRYEDEVRGADLAVVGSYVPEGVEVGAWVQETARGVAAFYDIDTPVTVAMLERGETEYLAPELVPGYDLYLSFTGGPLLGRLEREFGSPRARPFFCLVDAGVYRPLPVERRWELGYLGTYGDDRQPAVEELLNEPARRLPEARFCVAGPAYPASVEWPANVERIDHLPPPGHPAFFSAQAFTLNVTRREMVRAGWSPSVRLFEAAACAVPVISDWWEGLDRFFEPDEEILLARDADDVLRHLELGDEERRAIGERARARVLAAHTAEHRARELEEHVAELVGAAR
jgi:spore maturation protein CgeB